jgi:hypothetical protein
MPPLLCWPASAETPPDIGRFLFFLYSHARPALAAKAENTRLPRTAAESRAFVAAGLDLLSDWPDAFDEHVRRRLEDGDSAVPTAPERLGRWYYRMTRFRSEASRPFHDRLAAIIAAEFDGSYKGTASRADRFPAAWMSAASAAGELRVRADRIVAAVADGALAGRTHRSGLGHQHCVIARSSVVEVRRNRERYIDATSAAKVLGISSRQLKLLVDADVVARAAERPVLADGSIDRMALLEAVDDLRARTSVRAGEKLAFRGINLRRTTDRSALLELYRRIFRGDVVPAAFSEARTLGDFEFLRADVDEVLSELRRGEGWTVQQLAEFTGWKQACISAWCGQGLLQARPARYGRQSGYIISPEDLSTFQTAFVPVAALARSSGRSSRGILRQLGDRGIRTYGAFRDGPAERGHLVRVSDLLAGSSRAAAKLIVQTHSQGVLRWRPEAISMSACSRS